METFSNNLTEGCNFCCCGTVKDQCEVSRQIWRKWCCAVLPGHQEKHRWLCSCCVRAPDVKLLSLPVYIKNCHINTAIG